MKFIFPGFQSLSEFIAGKNGDCGPLAVLLCLHVRDQQKWPLSAAGLSALVADMAAKGCLMNNSNGESNIPGLDSYLTKIGIPHTTVGYSAFTLDALHTAMKNLAGTTPQMVLAEWSAAGAGLHDDEAVVLFHYSAFGGICTDPPISQMGYFRGDGDSNTDDPHGAATAPILTGWPAVEAAKPIGYILIPPAVVPAPPPADPIPGEIAALQTEVASLTAQIKQVVAAMQAAGHDLGNG